MRWLLRELVDLAVGAGQAPQSETGGDGILPAGGIVSAVADAASAFVSSASEAASELANELGSTVASSVVEANARSGNALDSATAMPLHIAAGLGRAAAVRGAELISMGDGGVGPERQPQHLDPGSDGSMWFGHGRLLSVVVMVHAAAFLYWLYLYVISRKLEARKSDHARRVLKKFKCVYEFAMDRALELMPVRKKRTLPLVTPSCVAPLIHGPGPAIGSSVAPSATFLNKINSAFKGDAP